MSFSKTITINTLAQVLGKFSAVFFGILGTIILRRFLGRGSYGDYVFVISLATMFSTVADFGSHLITVREASQNEDKQAKIIGNVIILRFFFSLLAISLMLLLAFTPSFSQGLTLALIVSGLIILAISFKNSLVIIFHTQLKLTYASIMNFLNGLLVFTGTVLLIKLAETKEISFFVLNLSLGTLIPVLILLPLGLGLIKVNFQLDKKIMKRIIFQAAPMGGILLLFTLYSKIDTIILKLYQGSETVGIYGLSYKIHDNLNVFAAFLMNALLPAFSKLAISKKVTKKNQFKKLFQRAFDFLFLNGFLLTALVFAFSPLIIKILTGETLTGETISLRILTLATFLSFFNHLMGYSIIALQEQVKSFFIALIALSFNLIANLILIPTFSFKAAAVNTVLTEGLVLILSSLVVFKRLNWRPKFFSFPKTAIDIFKNKGKIFDYE